MEKRTMIYTRITDTKHPLFTRAWWLYRRSFPPVERRRLPGQEKIMDNPLYHFELITEEDSFIGIILWWGFNDVRYVEHLATLPILRNKGYGQRILHDFITTSHTPLLLEVELPTDEVNRRRIGFYRRSGFILNPQPYSHPPYKRGGDYVPLMLMTYPNAITTEGLQRFLTEHHPVIHKYVLSQQR